MTLAKDVCIPFICTTETSIFLWWKRVELIRDGKWTTLTPTQTEAWGRSSRYSELTKQLWCTILASRTQYVEEQFLPSPHISILDIVQARNFNFPTWKRKTIPFFPHCLCLCGQNGIVFPFQVGKLKFHACKVNVVRIDTQVSNRIFFEICRHKNL